VPFSVKLPEMLEVEGEVSAEEVFELLVVVDEELIS